VGLIFSYFSHFSLKQILQPLRLLLPALLLAGFSAQAQAPANDNPAGAIALPLGATCTPTTTTNAGATTTVVTGLGYTNPGCGIAANPKDVWYTFTTNASGQGSTAATITVTGNPAGQVRVFSSTGGAAGPFVTVGCSAGTTNNTVAPPLDLRGLTPATTYYVDVAGYGSADTQGAFTICASVLTIPANDLAVTTIFSLGQVAQAYNSPHLARAVVSNLSLGALTNVPVTLTVTGANPFTSTVTIPSIAPNTFVLVNFAGYPLTALGTNTLTVTVPADDVATNNSQTFTQAVTASRLAFVDDTQPLNAAGVGIGVAGGVLAARYTLAQAGTISSITPTFVGAGTANTTYQVQLYDATGTNGTPGTVLYTSPTQTRPTATGSPVITVPNVAIPAGDFFVAIKELDNNVALAYQTENPLRPVTFYYQVPASAWASVNNTTLRTRLALEVSVVPAPACAPVQSLTATGITTTTANLTFTGTGNNYTVTYQAAAGTPTTVTPAPTASPVSLTGLTAGTTYTVSVTNNCAGGVSSPVATTTFTTLPLALTNDEPAGAITLPVSATCTPTNGTNVGATTTTPAGYANPGCGIAANPKDVWYKFTTAATGVGSTFVNIDVTGAPAGQVRVFSATSATGPFTEMGCASGGNNNTVAGALRVPNLTPGTTYYVFVSGYGSGDTQGAFTICVTGLATPPAPVYVTLPYTESFEGPWIDVLSTRDVPTLNWRNTPASGDNSWRREDDGFVSAGWQYVANEVPTTAFPIPPYVIRSSVGAHSARFHTFATLEDEQGMLDLYVDMSGAGNKVLSFDFINPSGQDSVVVLVSTDGGTTFGNSILTAGISTAFATRTTAINSTSATTVIRFLATSDFGNDDMGIDNLQLRVVTATRNDALAATVSLYPNPAHRAFTLAVPAGQLHNAAATLYNGLGQVVQQRQLSLPAAGGTTSFDVSSLAPGVYSLQLKTGTELVVKRVVVE
jgi:hypothetical protein